MRVIGSWRYRTHYKVRRVQWWVSDVQDAVRRFHLWLTYPETLKELSDLCMALAAAWIAVGMLALALWAAGQ